MLHVINNERMQVRAFLLLSAVMLAFTVLACINHTDLFSKFFDLLHPEWVVYLVSLLGLLAILLLLKTTPFPEDIALPFPVSLLIYPAMGFVAEILFHILPFTFLVLVMSALFKKVRSKKIIGISILVTAFLEAIYHMVLSGTVQFSIWVLLLVGFHILLFSLCQLILFRRYDFIKMHTFRMAYYLIWHVAWGTFRLNILF